ncbi:hypothetical protein GCM10007884_07680 [Methylobacterium brachythecii]|uniref:Uncharacterized protein n=2 Tax=Methylobacterium brachythecii TaxID=1176177 RepID=A0ABQ6CZP7_9HYPH|nr:hypothetical protein GCM10007884_07680 [Methylobacterium brachythecii]
MFVCGMAALMGPALAQSTGAPAGSEPATAPGGTEGIAGARNEREAIRSGDAIPAPRGVGEPAPPPPGAVVVPDQPPPAPRP